MVGCGQRALPVRLDGQRFDGRSFGVTGPVAGLLGERLRCRGTVKGLPGSARSMVSSSTTPIVA